MTRRPHFLALVTFLVLTATFAVGQTPNSATLVVKVPEDAKLYFDGQLTQPAGGTRMFATPELQPGRRYQYKVKAVVERDGRVFSQTKDIAFQAGQRIEVDLTNLEEPGRPGVSETIATPPTQGQGHTWPRKITDQGNTITMYQPQAESWEGDLLTCRAAVSVETAASPVATYGVIWYTARTETDKEKRVVTLEDFEITKVNFPAASAKAPEYLTILRNAFRRDEARTLDLDRLEASLAIGAAKKKTAELPLKNDPPRIIFSELPALLVLIDGKPALRKVPGADLERVINTRSLILFDEAAGGFFLFVHDHWLSAAKLDGPWKAVASPPPGLDKVKDSLAGNQSVDLLTDVEHKGRIDSAHVFVSTEPAELISTQGKPDMRPIGNTGLLGAHNSDNDIFLDPASQMYYVLISGRWFRSKSLEPGPWEFVPGDKLPSGFAKIPEENPRGNVLASIPGTPAAEESLIANSIPQTATIKTDEAKLDVHYDGPPQFERIEATPMQYSVNTPTPVILVNDEYYACDNGVWFQSAGPLGPWTVAVAVPPVIYTIPVSCPIYYVTHCRVYGWGSGFVRVGLHSRLLRHLCMERRRGVRHRLALQPVDREHLVWPALELRFQRGILLFHVRRLGLRL
jgi:uncharacterized protein (TIGR03000 family)